MAHRRPRPRGRASPSTPSATTSARGCSPRPSAAGGPSVYGPEHLERLERIRELQERRFSLAAIRALLDRQRRERSSRASSPTATDARYTLDELVERSGIDPDFADELHERRACCAIPPSTAATPTTATTSTCSAPIAELRRIGLPDEALVELGRIYAAGHRGDAAQGRRAVRRRRRAHLGSRRARGCVPGLSSEALDRDAPRRCAASSTTRTTARCSASPSAPSSAARCPNPTHAALAGARSDRSTARVHRAVAFGATSSALGPR